MIEDFLKAIPAAASHPLALAAYVIAAVVFLFVGARLRGLKSILAKIESVPPKDRKQVIEIASGTKLPAHITAEHWITLQRLHYMWMTVVAVILATLAVVTIALLRPEEQSPRIVPTGAYRTPNLGLQFRQSSNPIVFEIPQDTPSTAKVTLKPEPFQMLIPRDGPLLVQVAAWNSPTLFNGIPRIQKPVEMPEFFAPGTGMADWQFAEPRLFLSADGHNYLPDKRLENVSDQFLGKSVAYVSFSGSQENIPIEKFKGPLYLVVWRDLNTNKKFEWGEYELIVLDFRM